MCLEGVWGGDIEIMAISAILQVDVYVANRYRETDGFGEVRCSRIRSYHTLTEPKHCIYISPILTPITHLSAK